MSTVNAEATHELRPSLDEVHRSVPVGQSSFWRRLFAFAGPAYLVSVGYMDPGNWATDLEGGSRFGYQLLWVLLMSNLMAVLLQTLCARLGLVTGRDLAQGCRDAYSRPVGITLWVLCEIAIAACDLAEVVGTVIGLNLLFGLDQRIGVWVTAFDALLILGLQGYGIRRMEAFILALVATIGACFVVNLCLAGPDWSAAAAGLIPSLPADPDLRTAAVVISVGIVGATVMPHNLYLHSALVQTRAVRRDPESIRQACRFNLIDSTVALNLAFFVNASILVLGAAVFHARGHEVDKLEEAHKLLGFLLPGTVAAGAFAVALLCSGQSSTLTGTLAGQIVMEGFVNIRIRPWLRRLLTRSIAIIPAAAVIYFVQGGTLDLLIISQVILSLQLPFAVIPLIQFTGSRQKMGEFANPTWVKWAAYVSVGIILALNGYMVWDKIREGLEGDYAVWVGAIAIPVSIGLAGFLVYLTFWAGRSAAPFQTTASFAAKPTEISAATKPFVYRRIGVALEHTPADSHVLGHAESLARSHGSTLVLLHVTETAGARWHQDQTHDRESRDDTDYLDELAELLRRKGFAVETRQGYGIAPEELARLTAETGIDALVVGGHRHRFLLDLLSGVTVDPLRHAVTIPILAVGTTETERSRLAR